MLTNVRQACDGKPSDRSSFTAIQSMSNSEPVAFSVPAAPNDDSIRVIVVGTAIAVDNFIATQHRLGFAEVLAWSPPLPTPHDHQVMRILTKRLSLQADRRSP